MDVRAWRFDVPPGVYRLLGNMLGSADIIAQMSDRCYLEKCRDRLFPEFVWGGLASAQGSGAESGLGVPNAVVEQALRGPLKPADTGPCTA